MAFPEYCLMTQKYPTLISKLDMGLNFLINLIVSGSAIRDYSAAFAYFKAIDEAALTPKPIFDQSIKII